MSGGPRRVFLSRTSELMRLPRDVVDMAYFGARDEAPADVCRRVVPKPCCPPTGSHSFSVQSTSTRRPINSRSQSIAYTELEPPTCIDGTGHTRGCSGSGHGGGLFHQLHRGGCGVGAMDCGGVGGCWLYDAVAGAGLSARPGLRAQDSACPRGGGAHDSGAVARICRVPVWGGGVAGGFCH